MTDRPFRFSVHVGRAKSRAEFTDQILGVEALGYDTVTVPDHPTGHLVWGPALAVAAIVAPSLRVGPFVLDNDFRNPAFVALEAASLDLLTGGRLDLGLGAGWFGKDYEISGIPFAAAGVRVSRLAEAVTIIRGAFGGEPFSFTGEHYAVSDLGGPDGVLARPCPPILLGGGGKRMLTLAGRRADIVSITPIARRDGSGLETPDASAEAMNRKVGWLRDGAGDRFDALTINILLQHLTITDGAAATRAALEALSGDWEVPADILAESPLILVGSVDEIVEKIIARRQRWGISYVSVFGHDMEAFAPVVARLRKD
jgi:probable F420-dependent oxidoreductase